MDDKKFSVDDILEEVRRKKQEQKQNPADETPPANVAPADELSEAEPDKTSEDEKTPLSDDASQMSETTFDDFIGTASVPPVEEKVSGTKETPKSQKAHISSEEKVNDEQAEESKMKEDDEADPLPVVDYSVEELLSEAVRDFEADGIEEFELSRTDEVVIEYAETVQDEPDVGDTIVMDSAALKTPEELQEERRKKLQEFMKMGSAGPGYRDSDEDDEDELLQSAELEYTPDSDITELKETLVKKARGALWRGILALLVGVAAFAFSLLSINAPLPDFISPYTQPRMFAAVNLLFLLLAGFLCIRRLVRGTVRLVTLKSDIKSMAVLPFIGALVQLVYLLIEPQWVGVLLGKIFAPIAIFALAAGEFGEYLLHKRALVAMKTVTGTGDLHLLSQVNSVKAEAAITKGLDLKEPMILSSHAVAFPADVLKGVYSKDKSDRLSAVLAPVTLVLALVAGIYAFISLREVRSVVQVVAAVLCGGAAISMGLLTTLPMYRMFKSAGRQGAGVMGDRAIERMKDVNCVFVDDNQIFPRGTVLLHGIKTFGKERIDEAIINTASVMVGRCNTMSDIFLKVIQGRTDILTEHDSVVYENAMGFSAWIDSRRVLVGNRALMLGHGVEVPSFDYEKKYRVKGREVLYFSVLGELAALFVISYNPEKEIYTKLQELEREGMCISVKTTDPNLTAEKICEVYDLPDDMVTICYSFDDEAIDEVQAPVLSGHADILTMGNFTSIACGITSLPRVRRSLILCCVLQIAATLGGIVIAVAYTAVFQGNPLTLTALLLYQLIWLCLTWLIPNLRRF